MDQLISDRALVLGRKCITIARVMLGVFAGALVISNAITSFSSDESSQGPGTAVKDEISRFLASILLGVGLFTAVLLLSVFASVYVEQLALRLQLSRVPNGSDARVANRVPPDDSQWQR